MPDEQCYMKSAWKGAQGEATLRGRRRGWRNADLHTGELRSGALEETWAGRDESVGGRAAWPLVHG